MKKLIFLLASAGLLLTACIAEDSGMQEQISEAVIIGATYEAPEAEPGTRSIIENGGAFKWSVSDSFNAYSTGISYGSSFEDNVFEIYDYDGTQLSPSAKFIGFGIQGRIKDVAVCPATLKPTWDGENLTVTYPSEIAWVEGEADPYMVAWGFDLGAKNLSFKHLGGIIKLTVNEIPETASKVAVTIWGGRITGNFTIEKTTESSTTYWVVNDDDTEESSTVTFTFSAGDPNGMTFYVPVPVMEYSKIGFSVLNSSNETLFSFASSEKTRTVARKQIVTFPSITFIDGGGEGNFSNVITTDSGQTGTVTLPSTTNDVYVLMNSTAGEITLEPGSADPDSVFVTILKDATVNTLNIDLPNSTVVVSGENNSNLGTVNSTTSANTLKILNSPLTIGTATINQGNARIEGTVNSIVVASGATSGAQDKPQVQIFVSKDAALQTVTLNAKTDVIVEQPKDQIAVEATENKVYVIVNAEGSTATAQNGGDIYVTANATCAVTAGGGQSEDPSNESTAKVENNTGNQDGVTTNEDTCGKIDTGALVKAKIGNTPYYTLDGSAGAFANVENGETINLLVSVTLDQDPFNVELGDKAVTLDLGGNTLFGRTNLKSGSLTVQNGAIVCENYQPLNVYGNATSAQNYSVLTIASNVTVSGKYGVCIFGESAKANGYGAVANIAGKINAKNPVFVHGVLGNNIAEDMNNAVNINSGAVLTSTTDVAVALNGWATVNVKSGATINGSTGIAVKRGVLNVEDGATVTANGAWTTPPAANNNGTEPTGAAVSMTPTYSQYGAMAVNITGGTFSATGTGSEALYKSDGTYQSDATFTVTGGTFSSDPTEFVAPGYAANENTDGTWTVEPVPALAKIGDVTYTTLADAFTAAEDGQTIVVIRDIDLPATIQVDKTVTLDLDGNTIFNTADLWAGGNWSFFSVIGNGNLTVTGEGTIDAKENDCYTFDVKNGGVLTIKNGTFTGNISCVYLISDNEANTVCNIEGGHFSIKQLDNADPYHLLLNCLDADYTAGRTNFVVTGGSFEHFNPAASTSEPGSPVSFVPGGYYATEENDTWTVLEETNVAQIGETKYATLAEAFAAAQEVGTATIKILKDFAISGETFTIAKEKSIVLDLNGMTVTATGGVSNADFFLITNYGTFEVTDNSANHNGKLTYSCATPGQWTNQYVTIYNLGGTLTITAGTVENTTNYMAYAVNNSSNAWGIGDDKESVFNMTGGNLLAPIGDASLRVYQNCAPVNAPLSHNTVNVSGGYMDKGIFLDQILHRDSPYIGSFTGESINTQVNITGGRISNYIDLKIRHPFNTQVNITGGELDNCLLRVRKYTSEYCDVCGEPTMPMISISGNANATFGSENFVTSGWTTYNNQFTITGGTFNIDPSAYVALGYAATKSGNVWTVEEVPVIWANLAASDEEFAAATNGKVISISTPELLAKLAANVNSGTNYTGYTINLAGNIDLQNIPWTPIGTSDNPFKGTFDGCSNTISNLKVTSEVQGSGLFGVAGGSTIKDLQLNKVNILSTTSRVGALLGMATSSTNNITGITVTDVTIKASGHIGGIIGHLYTGTVNNLNVSGKLIIDGDSEGWDNGAICGYVGYTSFSDCRVEVDNTSLVSGGYHIGGMFGYPGEGGTTFTDCYTNVNVKGLWHIGGLIGNAQYGNNYIRCTVDNVTVTSTDTPYSDASATMDKYACGLFAGVAMSGSAITVNNCSFSGTLVSNVAIYDQGYYGYGYDGNYTVPTVNLTNGTTITLNN